MDRQLLNRATDGTDAPTPGYLYVDIAKNASSSPVACTEIATFLTRKLANKQNANIKWKCLKVITKTALTVQRGQFKRAVAQDHTAVAAIRQCTNFRGPPDPVRGDEPYNRVRIAAKECLDVIYSDTPTTDQASPYSSGVGGGGGGMSNTYGASPHAMQQQQQQDYSHGYGGGPSHGGGGGGGPRRMEGIGNPMFKDPRLDPQPENNIQGILREVGDVALNMIKDPLARNVEVQPRSVGRPGGGYGAPTPGNPYGRPPPGRNDLAQATGGEWTMASNRGPHAVGSGAPGGGASNDSYYKSREQGQNAFDWANKNAQAAGPSGVGGSWGASGGSVAAGARQPSYAEQHSATPSITVNHGAGHSVNHGSGGTAASDGSYEKNLIMELCPPGGMKPVPPPEKLESFRKAIPSLNSDLICPVLLDCLEEGGPWIMRAKALCVMETCIQNGTRPDNTNPYANFFYTCREEIQPLTTHARPAIRDPARRVCALMGIESSAAAPPAAAPPAPAVNLLDFDDVPASEPPAPPPTAPPPPPAEPTASGSDSMFGGLQVKAGTAQAASAPPAAPDSTSGNLWDGLNVNEPPAAAAPAPAPPSDIFASLSVKDTEEEKKSPSQDAGDDLTSVAASGSAFAFMNDNATAGPAATAAAPVAAVPSLQTFDPLKAAVSPNTAKQMMQVSPEQMQAMAYQQMLMQQQMQMQMMMQQQGIMPRGHPGMQMMMKPQAAMMMNQARPGVMGPHSGKTSSGFSFLDNTIKKEDKTFDFVKDAMKGSK